MSERMRAPDIRSKFINKLTIPSSRPNVTDCGDFISRFNDTMKKLELGKTTKYYTEDNKYLYSVRKYFKNGEKRTEQFIDESKPGKKEIIHVK